MSLPSALSLATRPVSATVGDGLTRFKRSARTMATGGIPATGGNAYFRPIRAPSQARSHPRAPWTHPGSACAPTTSRRATSLPPSHELVEGLDNGLSHQTLLGVTGCGKTYTIANVIERLQRPTLVMAHNKTLAAQLYGEFREFFPDNAVEYFVSYYDYYQPEAYVPSSDTYIEKDASINAHIEQMRLSATKALLERPDSIIVATVSSIYGLGDPQAYLSMVLHLVRGETLDQRKLLRRLADMQYTRNDLDLAQGTYRVRGDVIDIFPGRIRARSRARRTVRRRDRVARAGSIRSPARCCAGCRG